MKKIIYGAALTVMLGACNFEDINTNPDSPTVVPPSFIATDAILSMTGASGGKWYFGDSWLMKSTTYSELMEEYLYNKFERSGFGSYRSLIDVHKMVELAIENKLPEGQINAYKALELLKQAYVYYNASMEMGDVPCSESLLGEEGQFVPKYDSQEQVMETVLNKLNESSELFSKAEVFEGDVLYEGNVQKWQKVVNAFTLRVLNSLSKKEKVGSIDIKKMFEEVASLPLFDSEKDNLQRVYSSTVSAQWHPFYWENGNKWYNYPFMSDFFVDMLKELNDYRLFYYAEPAKNKTEQFASDTFDAYAGTDPTAPYGTIQTECNSGNVSAVNRRYHRVPQGEPYKTISYSEVQFVLAEAALRGWKTPLDAKTHYENAVRAAMLFTAENTPKEFNHGREINSAYIDDYLNGKAKFDYKVGLYQIMTQKYIASFLHSSWNSYYDYRRTGLPELPINPATNLNEVNTQMPLRWMYPSSEYSQNKDNVNEAIERQFGGTDTPNGVMWILK